MATTSVRVQAQVAVEDKLGLRPIIDTYEKDFLDTLASSHQHAKGVLDDSDVAFFADVIPWIASLIQVYVGQGAFLEAIDWAKQEFQGTSKPISVLTVLTTVYLIQRGLQKARGPTQNVIWKEIADRLGALLEEECAENGSPLLSV